MPEDRRNIRCEWREGLRRYAFVANGHANHLGPTPVLYEESLATLQSRLAVWDAVTFNPGGYMLCLACVSTNLGHYVLSYLPYEDSVMLFTLHGYNTSCLEPDHKHIYSGPFKDSWCCEDRNQIYDIVWDILRNVVKSSDDPVPF
jgi:hypothetical protein